MGLVYLRASLTFRNIRLSNPLIPWLIFRPIIIAIWPIIRVTWPNVWLFLCLFLAKDTIPAISVGLITGFSDHVIPCNGVLIAWWRKCWIVHGNSWTASEHNNADCPSLVIIFWSDTPSCGVQSKLSAFQAVLGEPDRYASGKLRLL